MNIYEKRPLSLILCIMLGGFSLFLDFKIEIKAIIILLSLLVFGITFIIKDLLGGRNTIIRIASICFAISIALGIIFDSYYAPPSIPSQIPEIRAVVTNVIDTSETSQTVTIKTMKIDDEDLELKMVFHHDYKTSFQPLTRGNLIEISGVVSAFTNDDDFSEKSYYRSRGYDYKIYKIEYINVLGVEPLSEDIGFIERLRYGLSNKLTEYINPTQGGLLSAIILGDKDALDTNTKLSFSLIGISHILALSGMHLVILTEGIKRVLYFLGLNKKQVALLSSIFAFGYMILTGCSPSIVRAAVMLICNNILFLLARTSDSLTTVPIAVTIILLFDPLSVYDLSLWLSALATFGIVAFANLKSKETRPEGLFKKFLSYIWDGVLVSFFAICATQFITIQNFSAVSLLTPITTLLFSFPITILIYLGLIILIIPFKTPLGIVASFLVEIVRVCADFISSLEWSIVSTDFFILPLLAYACSIAFYLLLVIKMKEPAKIKGIVISLVALPLVLGAIFTGAARGGDMTMMKVTDFSDTSFISSNGENTLIYNGNANTTSAKEDIKILKDKRILYLENLLLVTYNYDTIGYVDHFLSSLKVRTIYMPAPVSERDLTIAATISSYLSKYSTNLKLIDVDEDIKLGEDTFTLRLTSQNDSEQHVIYDYKRGDTTYTYLSFNALEKTRDRAIDVLENSTHILLGGYGDNGVDEAVFDLYLPNIKQINIISNTVIPEYTYKSYERHEVPIYSIGTS